MKNKVVITGGAGFVGSNLIEYFLLKTQFKIISIDNYSSGSKKNHIKSNRVKYLNRDTKYIFLLSKMLQIHIWSHFHDIDQKNGPSNEFT